MIKRLVMPIIPVLIVGAIVALSLRADSTNTATATIISDGSSTLAPLTEAAAETFTGSSSVIVDISGTGGGFKRFCAGETDIQNASRHIKQEEIDACKETGVEWYEIEIAYDGITIVVNPDNTWLSCITTDQLEKIWTPNNPATLWSDIDSKYPNEPINLYGPGTDSGTFDYFTKVITGEEGKSRTDYTPTEDDNVTVEGVSGDPYSLGYLGHSYAENNLDRLKVVKVDSGNGCVEPTTANVQSNMYRPLSRPLFVYVNANSLIRTEVQEFLRHYLSEVDVLTADTGLIAAPPEDIEESTLKLERAITGDEAPDSLDNN